MRLGLHLGSDFYERAIQKAADTAKMCRPTVKTLNMFVYLFIYLRRCLSSGLYRRVVYKEFTNVSEVLAASIIRATHRPNDGGSKDL
jgi:hypothetical protein